MIFHHNRPPGWTPEQQAEQDAAMMRVMAEAEISKKEKKS